MFKQQKRTGFTLIELLIVVAIIAILAAIAVPNFLEAQTRSKVARSKADIRSIAIALEAYRVDNNDYPIIPFYPDPPAGRWDIVTAHGWPQEYGLWFILTTPIAYITTIPHDTFWRRYNEQWGIWGDYYRVWNLVNQPKRQASNGDAWGAPGTVTLARQYSVQILMAGVGPDAVEDVSDGTAGAGGRAGIWLYDPTNGTISWGDIYYAMPGRGFDVPETH